MQAADFKSNIVTLQLDIFVGLFVACKTTSGRIVTLFHGWGLITVRDAPQNLGGYGERYHSHTAPSPFGVSTAPHTCMKSDRLFSTSYFPRD